MRFRRPRSRFAAKPRRWRHGSAAKPSCAICRGRNGSESTASWRPHNFDHIAHSPNCSIAKAEHMLDYRPRYGSIEAV